MINFQDQLIDIVGADRVLTDEPLSRHTSFHIGGPADYYVQAGTAEEASAVMQACRAAEIPYYLIGKGTNLLVSDKGYRGCIIAVAMNDLQVDAQAGVVTAGAGVSMVQAAGAARDHGLTGLEFAAGIPGSIGGGLVMNAGAYGGEMQDVVTSVQLLLPDGTVRTLTGAEMQFAYRDSIVRHPERLLEGAVPGSIVILGCTMQLHAGDPAAITATMQDLAQRRRDKQPLEYPSAGSTFKRPEGYYAGKLIMDAGLKGYRVGGACVSEKHAGFVVNTDHATAADVLQVIHDVQDKVYELNQIKLETEVIFLGEE